MTLLHRVTSDSQEVEVLKRTVVRLLMFGIPFCFSYVATRPAPAPVPAPAPAASAQTFVICTWDAHGEELTIATDKAACESKFKMKDAMSKPESKASSQSPKDLSF
jgi:hypothetical protein